MGVMLLNILLADEIWTKRRLTYLFVFLPALCVEGCRGVARNAHRQMPPYKATAFHSTRNGEALAAPADAVIARIALA